MTKTPRVSNDALLNAGLELARQAGKQLTRVESFGRSMMYRTADGKTVRVRTCNDHVLIVVADKPSSDAKLNTEGTDFLLIVMPEAERTPGKVKAYWIPTSVAVKESRDSHQAWLDSNPNTKGDNKTFCLWFRKKAPFARAGDYETKWARFLLTGEASTDAVMLPTSSQTAPAGGGGGSNGGAAVTLKAVIEAARQMVSNAAGVSPEAVKITIAFG